MSRESRQRLREEAKQNQDCQTRRKKLRWLLPLIPIAFIAAGICGWHKYASNVKRPVGKTAPAKPTIFKKPTSFGELCYVNTNDLGKCDIALMNLLCAEGLRGSENLNVTDCLATLDKIAASVKYETTRAYYKFREHPEKFNHSEGYFDMMMLATVIHWVGRSKLRRTRLRIIQRRRAWAGPRKSPWQSSRRGRPGGVTA